MKIGNVNTDTSPLVVAEIGNNHEGSYDLAERLVKLAAGAGAGAVKFQTIIPDKLVNGKDKKRIEQLKKFQLSYKEYEKLCKVAESEKIIFLSTPFDIESAHFLNTFVPAFKISSGDNNFWALIEAVAKTGKPVIISTGLTTMDQIIATTGFIQKIWRAAGINQDMAVLHCVSSYPTPVEEANLSAIRKLGERLRITVGYSDHTIGIDAAVLSVALGARIIEKHFTIDKNYSDFRDHRLSVDPEELSLLVKRVNMANKLLGNGDKCLQPCEEGAAVKMRRSIVAKRNLDRDIILRFDDLTWLRPGDGLAPGDEARIVGKKLKKSIPKGGYIVPDDVE